MDECKQWRKIITALRNHKGCEKDEIMALGAHLSACQACRDFTKHTDPDKNKRPKKKKEG